MLTDIIIVLTKEYRNAVYDSVMYRKMTEQMQAGAISIRLMEKTEFTEGKEKELTQDKDILWLSDDADVLNRLQLCGCGTIAVYHAGISGILSGTRYAVEGLEDIDLEYLNKIYQRYHNIPWEITQTERCRIREMGEKDLEDLYGLYEEPEVTRFTENLFADRGKERQYIFDYIENIYKYYGFGTWLIHSREDGRLIGRAGFNYRPGFEDVELGFVIAYQDWRKGYAYEVCSHLLKLGKEVYEFDRVQALADGDNTASVNLLLKLGFVYMDDVTVEQNVFRRYLYQ